MRKLMRLKLMEMTPEEKASSSVKITARISRLPQWIAAGQVIVYAPLSDEPDISPLFEVTDKNILFPRVEGEGLRVFSSAEGMAESGLGILEPTSATAADLSGIGLVLVPGRAFSGNGLRLGRGMGFYDRFLAQLGEGVYKLGVAFGCQISGDIPREDHDIRMDAVVTENGILP